MKIIKIQEKELNEARELQNKCVNLHLPTPPVASWIATITDKNGVEREQTIAKANSYVRNALNLLARYIGMASPSIYAVTQFKDGILNLKSTNSTLSPITNITNATFNIFLGDKINPDPENIDYINYVGATPENTWNPGGNLHYSNFDADTRKLITQFIIVQVNTSSTKTQYISEASVFMIMGSNYYLMLRDIFTPIAVGPGESIRFVYQTEVIYP